MFLAQKGKAAKKAVRNAAALCVFDAPLREKTSSA
jgi:hypothetical protein